jgi:two-component system, response regulator RegA
MPTIDGHVGVAAEPRNEWSHGRGLQPRDEEIAGAVPCPGLQAPAPLLLVEGGTATRARLERTLAARGFTVTAVDGAQAALAAAAETEFAYAVVEIPPGKGSGLQPIKELHELRAPMRIVVTTDHDSFAAVILALRAGAADYLPKPLGEEELVDALLGRTPISPPVPETPLGLQRRRWEHIQRVLEQCGRNLSEAARCLRMHRHTLQRILGKRAPRPRACNRDDATADLRTGAVARSYGRSSALANARARIG